MLEYHSDPINFIFGSLHEYGRRNFDNCLCPSQFKKIPLKICRYLEENIFVRLNFDGTTRRLRPTQTCPPQEG